MDRALSDRTTDKITEVLRSYSADPVQAFTFAAAYVASVARVLPRLYPEERAAVEQVARDLIDDLHRTLGVS